jgi:hypothetical protein
LAVFPPPLTVSNLLSLFDGELTGREYTSGDLEKIKAQQVI